jgi:hypothetical protein
VPSEWSSAPQWPKDTNAQQCAKLPHYQLPQAWGDCPRGFNSQEVNVDALTKRHKLQTQTTSASFPLEKDARNELHFRFSRVANSFNGRNETLASLRTLGLSKPTELCSCSWTSTAETKCSAGSTVTLNDVGKGNQADNRVDLYPTTTSKLEKRVVFLSHLLLYVLSCQKHAPFEGIR